MGQFKLFNLIQLEMDKLKLTLKSMMNGSHEGMGSDPVAVVTSL